jgi:hypothetical protein
MAWNPFGVMFELTATGGTVTRTSATQYTVKINAAWETYYSGAQTNYGMTASSGGGSVTLNPFGTYASSGSGSFTGTYSISGNGYATETYVTEEIAKIPKTDLTGYATEKYVDDYVKQITDVSQIIFCCGTAAEHIMTSALELLEGSGTE